MAKRFPKEFKDDVVRVARDGKFTHDEVAHDFHISRSSLKRWLHQADIDDGLRVGVASSPRCKSETGVGSFQAR